MGILPLGSVMNIARMLGVPRDLAGAAKVIAAGRQAVIDVGEANGGVFFEDASVGIQAAVFRHADEWEKGDRSSIFRAVQAAFRYRPRRMELEFDRDRRVSTHALMVVVSNAPYAGIGMTVAPDARLNDGLFDVVVWEHFSKASCSAIWRKSRSAGGATRRTRRRIARSACQLRHSGRYPRGRMPKIWARRPSNAAFGRAVCVSSSGPPLPTAASSLLWSGRLKNKKRPRQLSLPRPSVPSRKG